MNSDLPERLPRRRQGGTSCLRLVRDCSAAWLDHVVAIHEESATVAYRHIFTEAFPRSEVDARWRAHQGPIILAVENGQPVGFIAWDNLDLDALYVRPSAGGHGIGSILLGHATAVRRLWVLEQNHDGRSFYENRSWTWSGRSRSFGDAGAVTELLYTRDPGRASGAPVAPQSP